MGFLENLKPRGRAMWGMQGGSKGNGKVQTWAQLLGLLTESLVLPATQCPLPGVSADRPWYFVTGQGPSSRHASRRPTRDDPVVKLI